MSTTKKAAGASGMPPFPPYEKIRDSLAECLGDDEQAFRAAIRLPWVVTEKIHGANFCFLTDGASVRCAKRKSYLADDEDFFNHQHLLERLSPRIVEVAHRAREARLASSSDFLFVYGEIFGGKYPHPSVRPVSGVLPVQTGVWYSPRIEFCAFDVGVVREGRAERVYLDQEAAARLCEKAEVPFAKPLFRGSYGEAIAFPIGFETKIPARLGLPSLGPSNKAEGIVIKPERSLVLPARDAPLRPVIKRKIAEFAEDRRFHEAKKWETKPAFAPEVSLDSLKQEAAALVNENRWNAAVSKVGRLKRGDKERVADVIGLVCEDVQSELKAGFGKALRKLSSEEMRALRAFVEAEVQALAELQVRK